MRLFLRRCKNFVVAFARTLIRITFKVIFLILGKSRTLEIRNIVSEEIDSTLEISGIVFDGNAKIPLLRAKTMLTKEPDTIAWINDFFSDGDVFYDVGANVGVFSLYAAFYKNATVIAFEPSAENYAWLNRNIFLNHLDDNITAYNLALHDTNKISVLNLSAFMPGKAGHGFDITRAGSDYANYVPEFKQGVLGFRIDTLVLDYAVPFPNHVKIDVDGNDPLVLKGMDRILPDKRLRSIAIESNPQLREQDIDVRNKLEEFGFRILTEQKYINSDYAAVGLASNDFFIRNSS